MARTLTQPGPERTNRLIFVGAVTLAAVAAILVFVALSNSGGSSKSSSKAPAAPVTVVVAAQDIKAGTKLTADMLTTTTVDKSSVLAGALTDKTSVAGLTALYPLAKGEQISSAKVVGGSAAKVSPSYIIPAGRRAFPVAIQQSTSPNQLLVAGDHVDVIAVGKKHLAQPSEPGGPQDLAAAITVLQNIEVLAIEDVTLKPVSRVDASGTPINSDTSAGSIATNPNPTDTQSSAKVAVLSVDPSQAQTLAVAEDAYRVYLSLRAPGDDATPLDPANVTTLPANIQ